jgi:hypothetical protein
MRGILEGAVDRSFFPAGTFCGCFCQEGQPMPAFEFSSGRPGGAGSGRRGEGESV